MFHTKRTVPSWHQCTWPALAVVALMMTMTGCGPKPAVYIPREWGQPPPPPITKAPPEAPAAVKPQKPILQPTPEIQEKDLAQPPEEVPKGAVPSPQQAPPTGPRLASMHLVNSAKVAIDKGNPDQAISQLEQAIQVDAYNAEAFYYLARAWQSKGNAGRALEFARKSEILYQDQPQQLKKVYLLEAELLDQTGKTNDAMYYRQKASRFGP